MREGVKAFVFQTYRHSLSTIQSFKYPGRVITASDDDWAEVILNMRKVRKW